MSVQRDNVSGKGTNSKTENCQQGCRKSMKFAWQF